MNFFKRKKIGNDSNPLSEHERIRLRNIPRYHQTGTHVYGVPVVVNDVCTLLGDINEIINKGIYEFNASNESPFILDCGANIGMSVVYFKRLYPKANIVAFEPDPDLFNLLSKNIESFGFDSIKLENKAVWTSNDGVLFKQEGGHSGAVVPGSKHGEDIVQVPSVRLKDLLTTYDSIDMLKIDIEGAEGEVLFDCGRLLEKCNHIFVEYHSPQDGPQCLHSILELISKIGFRYHVQEAFSRKRPFIDKTCMVGMDLQLNLFFIREK